MPVCKNSIKPFSLGDAGLQSMLSGMDQNQIMQLLSGTGLGESSSRPTSVASNVGYVLLRISFK